MERPSAPRRRRADRQVGFWWSVHRVTHDAGAAMMNFIDNRAIIRRVAFVWVLWMTTVVIYWAMDFADEHPDMDGLKMAAILGAVLTPWNLMQAAIFKFYSDSVDPVQQTIITRSASTESSTSTKGAPTL